MSGAQRIHLHAWHGAISRRTFLSATVAAAGAAATSGSWLPAVAEAAEAAGKTSPDVLPMSPRPVVIPGGDVLSGPPDFKPTLIHQFVPGPSLDGVDAEPNGITNFRGLAAMGYTTGTARDRHGKTYNALTDNRVYQGEYIAVDGRRARGTFVEI